MSKTNITELLKEATKDILSDDTLKMIQEAFDVKVDEKVKLSVEAALVKQDEDYSNKLEKLVEAIDTDHTAKLHKVLGAQDRNNAVKLQKVVKKYNGVINEQASKFKNNLINQLDRYLDLYLEKAIPQEILQEAVKNKKATVVLENLRKNLAIDASLAKDSVRDAILDGKTQLDEARKALDEKEKEVRFLREKTERVESNILLEKKLHGISEKKAQYVKSMLKDKSPQFIKENLDYTLDLFDKEVADQRKTLAKEAWKNRVSKEDSSLINEETETPKKSKISTAVSSYLTELGQY